MGALLERIEIIYLFGRIYDVTPGDLHTYIHNGDDLIQGVSPEDWTKWRDKFSGLNLGTILQMQRIVDEFSVRRPDLLEVVLSEPEGTEWLANQIRILRVNLGIDTVIVSGFVRVESVTESIESPIPVQEAE